MPKSPPDYERDYDRLKFDRPADGVLRITLDREGKELNPLDQEMHGQLGEVWRDIDRDPEVRAVILTGAGRAFSAGGDFEMIETIIDDFDVRTQNWKEARELVYNLIGCGKPIVSAMRGPSIGAGLVAGLLADISIASKTARIIDGHTRLGVSAGDHAAIVWPLLCGLAKAKYYLLLCERMTGEEAERMGLVSLCVEDDELDAKSIEIASRLAAMSPSAIRWTKHSLNGWLRMAGPIFDSSLALEFLGFTGPDAAEGVASHLEKRDPVFSKRSPV